MVLGNIFSPAVIKTNLESEDKEEVFEELVDVFVSAHPHASRSAILDSIRDREAKLSTGITYGVAVPHAQTDQVDTIQGVIGISEEGIDYDALDGKPVHLIFMILSPKEEDCSLHLRVLKRLSTLLKDPDFYQTLISQKIRRVCTTHYADLKIF
ncbi:PTS sugar transporter subunit IIA [Brucepastera parasyntrophica]|uniref:PTS sugar transporter subunit IIA n=1 Tax=Brucepastera parasyntrophica TaxID=2880008 RepID=UPI00210B196A|nr:PTS sugar transporter subunit IIA [Brucepastera parasyntrophica]ULQ60360.1 PTS sugar transporter subunit IIA [Brucepastera parasyntrophica]